MNPKTSISSRTFLILTVAFVTALTPVEHYEMQKKFTRPTLMTGEYSGINPEDLLGKPTPTVSYPLDGAARAGREPYQTGLSLVKSQVK